MKVCLIEFHYSNLRIMQKEKLCFFELSDFPFDINISATVIRESILGTFQAHII